MALASVTGASARLNPLEILFVRAVPQRLDAKRYSDRSARRISTRDARVAGMSDAAVAAADEYDRGAHQSYAPARADCVRVRSSSVKSRPASIGTPRTAK